MTTRIRVTVANTHVSPLNPAIVAFDFSDGDGLDTGQALAQIIGFLWNSGNIGDGSSIADASFVQRAGAGKWTAGVHMPWPQEKLGQLGSDLSLNFGDGYGAKTFGISGGISGLGTSVLMTEHVAAGGRHNGRLYLPYCSPGSISASGTITNTARGAAIAAYKAFLMGDRAGSPWSGSNGNHLTDLSPVVSGSAGESAVIGVSTSQIPATLSSRKR